MGTTWDYMCPVCKKRFISKALYMIHRTKAGHW